eukprot:scaffold11691_cov76-Skeletonema_marinoi.AAC.1
MEVHAAKTDRDATFDMLYDAETFIGDSGASSHSTFSKDGAVEENQCETASIGHSGKAIRAESSLKLRGTFVDKRGRDGVTAILEDVKYSRDYNFNLLSLTKLAEQGWTIVGTSVGFTASKGEQTIKFDIKIQTASGVVFACRFVRDREVSTASAGMTKGITMNIKRAHEILGHHNEDNTRKIANHLGWRITRGTLPPCIECAKAKAKQKNVRKKGVSQKAEKPGGRIYLDVSKVSVRRKNGGEFNLPNKWWCIMVDETTGKKYVVFTRTKNGITEPVCEWMNKMKSRGIEIRRIRVDPGGENIKLQKRTQSADWQTLQPVDFEYTSRDTPQHNSLAEVAFPYLAGLGRAMLDTANVPEEERGRLVTQAIQLAVQLDGLRIIEINGKVATRDEHMYGEKPKWTKHMKRFGECGVVKEGKNGKAGSRGIAMMFVGYAANRESDSYVMYNPNTRKTVTTRDVIWMKRMMYEKKAHDKENSSEEENENRDSDTDTEEEEDPPTHLTRRRQTKRVRFAEHLEKIAHESNTDDETVEEAAEEDTSETEQNEEEAIEE